MEMMALASVTLQTVFVLINLLGLPGNIAALLIPLLWAASGHLPWEVFYSVLVLVAAGELVELAASYFVGKKYGVSNASFFASVIGSLIGGIFGAGIMLGIGAVPGTFLGAFLGTYIYEYFKFSDHRTALKRGIATFTGRFIGTAMKVVLGFMAVFETWKGLAGL
jgi:uncharacterized protein YqgC (DUF456 family)